MITIQELLFKRGLVDSKKTKLIKHKEDGIDLYNLYRTNKQEFLKYQERQRKDAFKGIDFIVVFLGEERTLARFVGVFRVLKMTKLGSPKIDGTNHKPYNYEYVIEEVKNEFDDLKDRVIIEWGKGQNWINLITTKKEVVEIQPGLHYKQFTDYFSFILDYRQLKEIVVNKYPDWKRMLSATNGIYLISDAKSGKLYVGAAYGKEGIWQRWSEYITTKGHGGNKTLKALVEKDKNYNFNFQFSILMLLPKTITTDQAIKMENLYKDKLGTNSFGLNNSGGSKNISKKALL